MDHGIRAYPVEKSLLDGETETNIYHFGPRTSREEWRCYRSSMLFRWKTYFAVIWKANAMRKNSRYLKYKYGAEKMKTGSFQTFRIMNQLLGNLLGFSMEPI